MNIQPDRRTLTRHPVPPATCGTTTGRPSCARAADPRPRASEAPDAAPASRAEPGVITSPASSDPGSPRCAGRRVKATCPRLDTATSTPTITNRMTPRRNRPRHSIRSSLDETRANRPGVTADERAELLARAAQHRREADTDRERAGEDRL